MAIFSYDRREGNVGNSQLCRGRHSCMHESKGEGGLPNVTCLFLEVSGAFQVVCNSFFYKFQYLGGDMVLFADSLSHSALITS